jgi:hypothetical protein
MNVSRTGLGLRLLRLWALSLIACVAVGVLLVQLHQQSGARVSVHNKDRRDSNLSWISTLFGIYYEGVLRMRL